jgi:hypothetical protein
MQCSFTGRVLLIKLLLLPFPSHLADCPLSLLIKKTDYDVSNREIIGLLKEYGPFESNHEERSSLPGQL